MAGIITPNLFSAEIKNKEHRDSNNTGHIMFHCPNGDWSNYASKTGAGNNGDRASSSNYRNMDPGHRENLTPQGTLIEIPSQGEAKAGIGGLRAGKSASPSGKSTRAQKAKYEFRGEAAPSLSPAA